MDFKYHLIEQIKKHPCMQPQDVVKLCYQAAFGAEHLLSDISAARKYFDEEFDSAEPCGGELFEALSDEVSRIDLGAWKNSGLPSEWLFRMFVASASVKKNGMEAFDRYLCQAEEAFGENMGFSPDEWRAFLEEYKTQGVHAVHHSNIYRENEKPAYRIVDRRFLHLIPVLRNLIKIYKKSGIKIISIDGRAASGKSTLAGLLKIVLNAAIIHMDDFFLPCELRTKERLDEPGGNIHYERFIGEVLSEIRACEPFSYRVFDCERMDYCGQITVAASEWRIVEGCYSHHPRFGEYADLTVFCNVSKEEQSKRILARNGEKMAKLFAERWIPMEELYFSHFGIEKISNVVI